MTFLKSQQAEAADLRAKIDRERAEADRLREELPPLEAEAEEYARTALAGEHPMPGRAGEVSARRGWIGNRLREIDAAFDRDEQRLRVVTDRLEAGPRAERARVELRRADEWVAAAEQRCAANAAAVERLRTMQAEHAMQAAVSLRQRKDAILQSVGLERSGEQSEQSAVDLAVHAQTGLAIEEALRDAEEKQRRLGDDLMAANAAAAAARRELAVQLAAVAELRHAEALSAYLPALAEHLAAHTVAHEWQPAPPAIETVVAEALPDAIEAFRQSLIAKPSAGVVAKATKAVRELLS